MCAGVRHGKKSQHRILLVLKCFKELIMSQASKIVAVLISEDSKSKFEQCKVIAGSFYYYKDSNSKKISGMIHSCPCGCGNLGSINLEPRQGRPLWINKGTKEKPTLSPSVGIKKWADVQDVEADGYHWHGFLKKGIWVSVYDR